MSIFTAYFRVLSVGMLITSLYKAQLKIVDSCSEIASEEFVVRGLRLYLY